MLKRCSAIPAAQQHHRRSATWGSLTLLLLAVTGLAGCQKTAPQETTSATTPTTEESSVTETNAGESNTSQTLDPNHPELKWIGKIPYDVFFDQPLQVASDSTVVAVSPAPNLGETTPKTPAETRTDTPAETPANPPETSTANGEIDWPSVAAMSVLVDEVKQIRVRLERNLQKVSDFNKNVAAIAEDGAVLAAIAATVERHPEDVNWKDKAANIRDLGNEVYMKAAGSGSKPFNATKKPFEDLKRLLDGESPATDAPAEAPFAEVADRAELMKRLNSSYNSLKSNVNSAARLEEEKEKVQSELAIMTLLMTVMGDSSYDQADDPRYAGFVETIVGQQHAAAAAASAGNFDEFSSSVSKINVTCNECHMLFRTTSE